MYQIKAQMSTIGDNWVRGKKPKIQVEFSQRTTIGVLGSLISGFYGTCIRVV